jgi:lincosamide nucleotidyltransferase A/C/D/E
LTSIDVIDLYATLENLGVEIWIDGGWGVDALLGEQSRPHQDLDIYGPAEKAEMYPAASLTGTGLIVGRTVRCISPAWILKFHSGYELEDKDFRDVFALCRKFGIDLPPAYLPFKRSS